MHDDATAARQTRPAQLWFGAWLGTDAHIAIVPAAARATFDASQFQLPTNLLSHHAAASAHYFAHRHYGGDRFAVGSLRQIQRVLVSLFEDARVEQLALRDWPGLRRLWQPYFCALDTEANDVDALLQRLAVALFDPVQPQHHPWLDKARRLFLQAQAHWHDAALSRELGNLLGNDLGQMRLQFNWKTHVVEPLYRDDHAGLWLEDEVPPEEREATGIRIDAEADAIAISATIADGNGAAGNTGSVQCTIPQPTKMAAYLPEWDYARGFCREHWVTVQERTAVPAREGCSSRVHGTEARALSGLIRRHRSWRRHRHRWHEGDELDIDACIRAVADQRLGEIPSSQLFGRTVEFARPITLLILIDCSRSMQKWLDHAKALTLWLTESLASTGDDVAVYGFCSNGRNALYITEIKNAADDMSLPEIKQCCTARLAGLAPAYSTRLGAALRYAQGQLKVFSKHDRCVLVLGDGEVGDIDIADPQYLVADALHAEQRLQKEGIGVIRWDCTDGRQKHTKVR